MPVARATWIVVVLFAAMGARAGGRQPSIDIAALTGVQCEMQQSTVCTSSLRLLNARMSELFGRELTQTDRPKKGQGVVFIGRERAVAAGIVSGQELKPLSPGGYVIRSRGNRIAVVGASPWSTHYGVQRFVELLGDHAADKQLPALNMTVVPALHYRNYSTRNEWAIAKKGLNPELFGRDSDLWIDHSAGYLVPKKLYYDKHPEYYAQLQNGKRIPKDQFTDHRTPLCLSNPDVTRISIERALGWVEQEIDKTFFPITYGDTGVWCQCADCLALDPVPGQYATRLLSWVNPIAQAIGDRYPDKIVVTFAYGGSDQAPPKIRPAKNVWVCNSVSFAGNTFWDHGIKHGHRAMRSAAKIDGWLKIAPHQVAVCEYQGKYYPALVDTLAGKMRYYRDRGIRGLMFSFGQPQNFPQLWKYAYPRLMWTPDLSPLKLAEEFAASYYGSAAVPMKRYFRLCHKRYQSTLQDGDFVNGYPVSFYSGQFVDKALSCFSEAARLNPGKAAELAKEERLFIMDVMAHPESSELDAGEIAKLRQQLDRLLELTKDTKEAKIALARTIHRLALRLDGERKGTMEVVTKWLQERNFPRPLAERLPNGVRLPPEVFMYAGYGPRTYRGHRYPVPAKMAVAVYVKGNSRSLSDRMEATFELERVPGDGAATLDIEGQDCDHEVDTSTIRVAVNGKEIYNGQTHVVKRMWSRQSFKIPPGILRNGFNRIEISNVSDPRSIKHWYERWFMLADATIRFNRT